VYLRTILDPENIGQYAFHFDWISLRCGLDQNMLVIAGLEWRNPPMFTNTPYFLRIQEINFVIDAMSVYRAVMFKESIKISQIKLDRAGIYLEKLSQRSINRATAAAALKKPILERNTQAEVSGLDNSVHKDTAAAEADPPNTDSPLGTPVKSANTPRKQLPVGLLNLWACMGAQDFAQETSYLTKITKNISKALSGTTNMVQLLGTTVSRINVTGAIYKGAQNVTSTIGSAIGKNFLRTFGGGGKKSNNENNNQAQRDRTLTMSTVDSIGTDANGVHFAESDSEMDMNASTHSNNKGDSTMTMAETLALLQAEYPDLVLPPLPEEAFDEEDVRHNYELSHHTTPTASVKSNEKKKKETAKGFGIPYKLEIDQLYLHDVQLHAQDFLNAKHSKDRKAGVIKLKSLTMFRNELTASPDRRLGGKRQGIYLDDVVWRLVNKLLSELLRHNSIAMMVLLSSAAANRTTVAVSSGAGIASYGATTTKKAFTGLGSVFSGGGGNNNNNKSPVRPRSDTASSAGMDASAHSEGAARTAPLSTASNTHEKLSFDAHSAHTHQEPATSAAATPHSTSPTPGSNSPAGAPTAQTTATTAAQSAFKALNATGADVQKNAMNAFQTILKRTGSTKQP